MNVKNKKTDLGVSEIVGEILLLSIAIVCICGISYTILSTPQPAEGPIAELSGTISENQIILVHQGGESLPFDTKILLSYKNENLIIGEYLVDSNSNGLWDIGEKVYYPVYEDFNETSNPDINIMLADINSNSLVFVGKVNFIPECDMKVYISVNNSCPREYEIITFNISAVNDCNINVTGIQVEFILPEGFTYNNCTTTQGLYNASSGIWNVGTIAPNHFANLSVNASIGHVKRSSGPTQLALILDGSGSINSNSWNLMRQGISSAMNNSSYFPEDGTCELTVVQFGGNSPPRARTEISPTVINSSNINSVKNTIKNLVQMKGYTPMSCGVYLACDKVKESSFFNSSKRQIFLLVTDGIPNCERISGTYNANYRGDGWSRLSNQKHNGSYSAGTTSSAWGDLISNDLNTTNATSIKIDFWYRLNNTESDDFEFYLYNGTSYNLITSLGDGTNNTWLHYINTITNPQYFISNFKIRFNSQPETSEYVWIDDVVIQTDKILFNESFEKSNWSQNWENSGQRNTEEAISYLVNTLQMSNVNDEFNSLAVQFAADKTSWLKNKVVWPQPGYYSPPFTIDPHLGWVRNVSTWQDFAYAINESFGYIFNNVEIKTNITIATITDPKLINNKANIILTVLPS